MIELFQYTPFQFLTTKNRPFLIEMDIKVVDALTIHTPPSIFIDVLHAEPKVRV